MNNSSYKTNALFLLTGGFGLFLLTEVSYLINSIIKQCFLYFTDSFLLVFVVSEIVYIISFILFTIYGLRLLFKNNLSYTKLKNVAIYVVASYFVVQILQAFFQIYFENGSKRTSNHLNYIEYLSRHPYLLLITSILIYILYLIYALILFNYSKKDDF